VLLVGSRQQQAEERRADGEDALLIAQGNH